VLACVFARLVIAASALQFSDFSCASMEVLKDCKVDTKVALLAQKMDSGL